MPRTINKLSDAAVKSKNDAGRYADGGGLYLQVSSFGTKAWVFRYMLNGKARHMGLGAYPTFKLAEARERARKARQQLADGDDPLGVKDAERAAALVANAKRLTFKDAAERYIAAKGDEWKNPVHRQQWENTLKTYAEPIIGALDVAEIQDAHVMNVLQQPCEDGTIWTKRTETASRLRGRIEAILNWATVAKFRAGDNPARWKGHLEMMLPTPTKIAKPKNHAAMPYSAISGFISRLRGIDGVSPRALEFLILTATRTREAINARWDEFVDLDGPKPEWRIPAERMKAGKAHYVPLSDRTVAILKTLPKEGDYLFPGAKKDKPLSNMAMLQLLKHHGGADLTVHGFRSTFRDWAGDHGYDEAVAEHALAHQLANKAKAAYQRSSYVDRRRKLMADWARFCEKPQPVGNNVVAIEQARA